MNFLRVGDTVLNLEQVNWVGLRSRSCEIRFNGDAESTDFGGAEAVALVEFFSRFPDVPDLLKFADNDEGILFGPETPAWMRIKAALSAATRV